MRLVTVMAAAFAVAVFPHHGYAGGGHDHHHESPTGLPSTGTDTSEGEVTRVDAPAGRIFIKHGDMRKIGILAMLMVYDVQDPAMLEQVRVGDKVSFTVQRNGSQLTVTRLDVIR